MTRIAITALTFGALAVAMALGLSWFVVSPPGDRWEPAVNSLALLAGITGIFAERWASQREQRNQAIESIRLEMARNRETLDGEAFSATSSRVRRVYPRLVQSAVDSALSSGALSPHRDAELIDLLHRWRTAVASVNRRLELTEMLVFTSASDEKAEQFHTALHSASSFFQGVRTLLDEAQATLGAPVRG
ncbi:hypothetical protein ADK67_17795 [Saccharothrix sp. NRRL B-16348]|jgi:hypothetical protein|uniref:hypothetical protein n=1 Tax=Saccharothrix sp. NRRL B-16348 TaxID=1415542 RepID=UPI0006AF0C26|nr:hypothetical protein [Saccharothrix sp. NRRL B-16348]KOX24804.1 hypothetical protein ADK67_17795 [Saccharothrix sp. NRRL B-16348]